jgi:hypothetical protein
MVGVHGQHAAEALLGEVVLVVVFVDDREVDQRVHVDEGQAGAVDVVIHRLFVVPEQVAEVREVEAGVGVGRVNLDGLLVGSRGLLKVALFLVNAAARVIP